MGSVGVSRLSHRPSPFLVSIKASAKPTKPLPPFPATNKCSIMLGGQSRADQIEVSLNEDIISKEDRKMKQGH